MRRWSIILLLALAASGLLAWAGLPTPFLFGGLLGALVWALLPTEGARLPAVAFNGGQAVVGVVVGASVDWASMRDLGGGWAMVLLASCFSLVVSVLAGRLLLRHGVSRPTATFSTIAGGAAGLTALAEDLGADDRVVAVLQYLRLLVVLVTMPVVVVVVLGAGANGSGSPVETGSWVDWVYAAAAVALGLVGGKVVRMPSFQMLGPLVAAAVLSLTPAFSDAAVPPVVKALGYLAIGVHVGLKFTPASIRQIGALVPTALVATSITLVSCAALAWLLTVTTGVSALDAYLATTPGGIYAVMGTAEATGGDVGFVAASQVVRLLIILGSAPFVAAYLRRGEPGRSSGRG
ncbi:MAG: AbrB family transcriptional regulator [Nocardioides sp.]|uniref:AbrB family transcriptional regulator n=1 Tax=Nocardioides sp. TaxID=35761 RepID=UPI003F0CCF61